MSPIARSGGGGGAISQIFSSTAGASVSNFDITSIPGTFTVLRLISFLRDDSAGAGPTVPQVTFNGDTGANYDFAQVFFQSPSASGSSGSSQTHGFGGGEVQGGSAANLFAPGELVIPFYANTTGFKIGFSFQGSDFSNSALSTSGTIGFTWRSTAAITRITVTPNLGSHFVAGSAVVLYGMT